MTAYALSEDFGTLSRESDRRFRRLVMAFGLPALILGILIPMVDIPSLIQSVITPQRYAKLIQQKPIEEKKIEEKKEEPKPEKPKLTQEQKVAKAQERARKNLAALDSLAELRDVTMPTVSAPLQGQVITSSSNANRFTASAANTSGGIGEIGIVNRNGSRTGLGDRKGTAVSSSIGHGKDTGGKLVKGRTLEEIQLVFDRTKGAFYTMYVREQREHPDMAGKVTVRITIAPSGAVTKCTVVGSELNDPEFEKKVAARVMLMDFGAKDVGDFTIDYPILFFPS